MKKVIAGKMYNTETASEIGKHKSGGFSPGDFGFFRETLFRTPGGAFFLVGTGGAMTKYARSCGNNSWTGNDNVFIVLETDEAREWCEKYDVDADVIAGLFRTVDA